MAREGIGASENLEAKKIRPSPAMKLTLKFVGADGSESSIEQLLIEFTAATPVAVAQEMIAKIRAAAEAIAAGKKLTIEEKTDGK